MHGKLINLKVKREKMPISTVTSINSLHNSDLEKADLLYINSFEAKLENDCPGCKNFEQITTFEILWVIEP